MSSGKFKRFAVIRKADGKLIKIKNMTGNRRPAVGAGYNGIPVMPIESAPRDGTAVLGIDVGGFSVPIQWSREESRWDHTDNRKDRAYCSKSEEESSLLGWVSQPTEAPKDAGRKTAG